MTTALHAAGYPGAAQQSMIRTVFADTMEKNLYATTYLPRISSSRYIGKIKKMGDTIKIARVPKTTTHDYARGQELEIDSSNQAGLEMEVKRAKYWTQFWDQLDLEQTHLELTKGETVVGATAQVAEDVEKQFLAVAPTYAHARNVGANAGVQSSGYNLGTAAVPFAADADNIVPYLTQFFSVMAEHNISDTDGPKSVLIPEVFRWYLVNSPKLSDASTIGEASSLKTNKVTSIGGIDVYASTLLNPVATSGHNAFPILAVAKNCLDFVMALNKVEATTPSKMFGVLTKGLVLYDWKATRSEGIACGYAYAADTSLLS